MPRSTGSAVVTESATHLKYGIVGPLVAPKVAIIDPSLTLTLPPLQTASTGLDALAHAVEGYLSILENPSYRCLCPLCTGINIEESEAGSFTVAPDIEARTNMSLAAMLGDSLLIPALPQQDTQQGRQWDAGARYLHGLAVSLPLPEILEYNRTGPVRKKLSKIATAMGVKTECMPMRDASYAAITAIRELIGDLSIPTFAEASKLTAADAEAVAAAAACDGETYLNPRTLDS